MGLVEAGLALVRFVIAKRCFRCGSSLLSSHKRKKKIMCVEVSPSRLFLGIHIPIPFPSHPSSTYLSQSPTTNPSCLLEGSRSCILSTSPLSATPQQGLAGSGFWHPLVQADWTRRGLGWMGTG